MKKRLNSTERLALLETEFKSIKVDFPFIIDVHNLKYYTGPEKHDFAYNAMKKLLERNGIKWVHNFWRLFRKLKKQIKQNENAKETTYCS